MERRRSTRVHTVCPVRVHFKDGSSAEGVVSNISTNGMGVISSGPLNVGADVTLDFSISSKVHFKGVNATIMREHEIGEKFFSFIGVCFHGITSEEKAALSNFILEKRLEQYKLQAVKV